jgi:activator of HSP90 ATPase
MSAELRLTAIFPVSAQLLYTAWMSTRGHSAFTGSKAVVDPVRGGRFTAWDGYISGRNLETEPFSRAVQAWRNMDFPGDAPDSRLEVLFEDEKGGAQITLIHSGLPEGLEKDIEKAWKEYYFKPMKKYFTRATKEKWADAFKREMHQ